MLRKVFLKSIELNITNLIKYLKTQYFVDGGWKEVTPQGVANSGRRIMKLINS